MIATLLYFCINIYEKRIYIANLQHCTDHELYIIKEKSNKQLKINWRLWLASCFWISFIIFTHMHEVV